MAWIRDSQQSTKWNSVRRRLLGGIGDGIGEEDVEDDDDVDVQGNNCALLITESPIP
jgi:hypothetical protein